MRKIFLFFLMCIALAGSAVAQRTVTGTVVAGSDGTALPGVAVSEKGTTHGTITDVDGKYSITVASDNATLVFTFVGMKPASEVVKGRKEINVTMADENCLVLKYGYRLNINLCSLRKPF